VRAVGAEEVFKFGEESHHRVRGWKLSNLECAQLACLNATLKILPKLYRLLQFW